MNTKKSSLSKVATFIANDFKKNWILAVVEFAIFFFSTSSVLMMTAEEEMKFTASAMMNPQYPMNGVIVMVFPLIMAVMVFSYLHNVSSVTATHSLPISRKEHFTAHLISGYLLTSLPIIANGIILGVLSQVIRVQGQLVFTVAAVAKLILLMMLISLVTYAFSVLAGMLVGTVVLHAFGAIVLNIFIPAIILIVDSDLEVLLKGYCTVEWIEKAMYLFLPIAKISTITAGEVVWFIALSLILIAVSIIAYSKRALENATDALAFKFTEPLIVGFLTFMFASAMGEYFISYNGSKSFLIGMGIGAVIGYILLTMICEKTTRIFNGRNIRNAAIFVCILGLFVFGSKFDILGYSKLVPEAGEIKTAEITALDTSYQNNNVSGRINWCGENGDIKFDSKSDIEKIRKIHEDLTFLEKNTAEFQNNVNIDERFFTVGIKYVKKSGVIMRREYTINFDDAKKLKSLKELYESQTFKKKLIIGDSLNFSSVRNVTYVSYVAGDHENEEIEIKDVAGLVAALDKDFANRSYMQEINGKEVGGINIEAKTMEGSYYSLAVLKTDTNTLAFIK